MVNFIPVATLTDQTFLITPRNAGQIVRLGGVDTVATEPERPVRVYGSGQVTLGEGWWDRMLIVDGEYAGGYFDGDSPSSNPADYEVGDQVVEHAWTGTPHASTSTRTIGLVTAVPDPVEYERVVERMIRSMHSVKAVAGPTVEQKLHRGDTWGYIVEFVLVAEVPWVFGITKPIELAPSLPVVVQDVPFNLVPYPSAELEQGTVIAATNYATNPSIEVDTTNWVTVVGGGIAAGNVAGSRSTELASAGVASAKAVFTAPGNGGPGSFGAQHEAQLPGITSTTRFSVNLWAAASVQSGTAVLGTIEYHAIWMSASAVLRDDLLGTNPAGGGALSVKSILPPAGTTKVAIKAIANVTSWSTGAVVRVYVDAAAVTVP